MTADSNYANQIALQSCVNAIKLHTNRTDGEAQRDQAIIEASIQWYEDLLAQDKCYDV